MGPQVHVEAAKTNRSLVDRAPVKRRVRVDPQLLFWRRMIDSAVADAVRTKNGLPTDLAIMQRYWIEDFRPPQSDKDEWERSFECACSFLNMDAAVERKRLVAEIDATLLDAYRQHVRSWVYVRKAAVMQCAGVDVTIAKARLLPLVSEHDYEDVAGIEHGDPVGATRVLRERMAA